MDDEKLGGAAGQAFFVPNETYQVMRTFEGRYCTLESGMVLRFSRCEYSRYDEFYAYFFQAADGREFSFAVCAEDDFDWARHFSARRTP